MTQRRTTNTPTTAQLRALLRRCLAYSNNPAEPVDLDATAARLRRELPAAADDGVVVVAFITPTEELGGSPVRITTHLTNGEAAAKTPLLSRDELRAEGKSDREILHEMLARAVRHWMTHSTTGRAFARTDHGLDTFGLADIFMTGRPARALLNSLRRHGVTEITFEAYDGADWDGTESLLCKDSRTTPR